MRLILSRKGFDASRKGFDAGSKAFDTSNGEVPSPILPDGTLCSLPIPDELSHIRFGDIRSSGVSVGNLARDLTNGRITADTRAHLDPDLRPGALQRSDGWQPLFGQADSAQGHLRNQRVNCGDLFLFFGWFRRVTLDLDGWRYVPDAPNLHVLFGWLQIGETLRGGRRIQNPRPWMEYHPHVNHGREYKSNNTLYVATRGLCLDGKPLGLSGGGVFPRYHDSLRLTAPGIKKRSVWRLPAWFKPSGSKKPLSYHGKPSRPGKASRWTDDGDFVLLKTVGRGQEFVLDCHDYPEALGWLRGLFEIARPASSD